MLAMQKVYGAFHDFTRAEPGRSLELPHLFGALVVQPGVDSHPLAPKPYRRYLSPACTISG